VERGAARCSAPKEERKNFNELPTSPAGLGAQAVALTPLSPCTCTARGPSCRVLPSGAVHAGAARFGALLVRYLSTVLSEHSAGQISSLYFPVSHSEHSPPFGPVYPAIHSQLATTLLLPPGETEFVGHVWQHVSFFHPSIYASLTLFCS
jgi:hypothetical protein